MPSVAFFYLYVILVCCFSHGKPTACTYDVANTSPLHLKPCLGVGVPRRLVHLQGLGWD